MSPQLVTSMMLQTTAERSEPIFLFPYFSKIVVLKGHLSCRYVCSCLISFAERSLASFVIQDLSHLDEKICSTFCILAKLQVYSAWLNLLSATNRMIVFWLPVLQFGVVLSTPKPASSRWSLGRMVVAEKAAPWPATQHSANSAGWGSGLTSLGILLPRSLESFHKNDKCINCVQTGF